MKFLVDAQLPLQLKKKLANLGHDVIHASDLPNRSKTSDMDIIRFAERDERVVITKDHDFIKHNLFDG